jgi:hypothetical protein
MFTVAKSRHMLGGILFSLAACASTDDSMNNVDVVPCVSETPEEGTSVSGMLGAVWADLDGNGCSDGYVWSGRYYRGAPVPTDSPRIEYQMVDLDMIP